MGQIMCANLNLTHTTPQCALGTIYQDPRTGATYQYMQADGAVGTAYLMYTVGAGYQIDTLTDLDTVYPADTKVLSICVPQITFADNAYGWVFVGPGPFTGTAAEDIDATDILYGHGTAGTISDTASAIFLPGVTLETAILSGATGELKVTQMLYAVNPA